MAVTIHFDGACRGNPGPRGIGYTVRDGDEVLAEGSEAIGRGTNNEAEYRALVAGLTRAVDLGVAEVVAVGDSQLVVKQVRDEWAVNAENLRPLRADVLDLAREFDDFTIRHAPRDENETADGLANAALDG